MIQKLNYRSGKNDLFSHISVLVTAVGNPVMECASGLYSLSHSEQVQWLFNFYVCGVQEMPQTLLSNLIPSDFISHHCLSASGVIDRGTCDISSSVKKKKEATATFG